eukprot:351323-Chlamydomonas_euryale.AAC.15
MDAECPQGGAHDAALFQRADTCKVKAPTASHLSCRHQLLLNLWVLGHEGAQKPLEAHSALRVRTGGSPHTNFSTPIKTGHAGGWRAMQPHSQHS